MLQNILQCTEQSPQQGIIWCKMSVVQKGFNLILSFMGKVDIWTKWGLHQNGRRGHRSWMGHHDSLLQKDFCTFLMTDVIGDTYSSFFFFTKRLWLPLSDSAVVWTGHWSDPVWHFLSPSGSLPNPEDRTSPLAGDQSGLIGGEAVSHFEPPSSAAWAVQTSFEEAWVRACWVPKGVDGPETPQPA